MFVSGDYIFPNFAKEANKENVHGRKKTSGISSLWGTSYEKLIKYWDALAEHLPTDPAGEIILKPSRNLCSHSGKKFAVRTMGSCSPVVIIFRAGWEMRNAHTLFDYLIRDQQHDVEAAKVLAGWTNTYSGGIWGGIPPHPDDLIESKVMLNGGGKAFALCRL